LDAVVKAKILQVSAATIDRALADAQTRSGRAAQAPHGRRGCHPAQHPVRTLCMTVCS